VFCLPGVVLLFEINYFHYHYDLILLATLTMRPSHPVTEVNTRIIPGDKTYLAHKLDSLTIICELIF
jgi:hypothetical protein